MEFAPLWFALLIPLIAFALALMLALLFSYHMILCTAAGYQLNKRGVRTGTY